MGIIAAFLMGAVYLTDTYSSLVPASLSLSVFGPVAGFGFPLFAPSLYSGLELWPDTRSPIARFHCHWPANSNNACEFGEKSGRTSRLAMMRKLRSVSEGPSGPERPQSQNDGISAGTTPVGIWSLKDPSSPFGLSDW